MKTCDDCFEDFEPRTADQTVCDNCKPVEYDVERCAHAWKIIQTRGFRTQSELDEYQKIKKIYKELTGRNLPKVDEKLKRSK